MLLDATSLGRMEISTWRTDAGDVDIVVGIPDRQGSERRYEELGDGARRLDDLRLGLACAQAVAVGPNVRYVEPGDSVLFNPEDRFQVEVRGEDYILPERDIHTVPSQQRRNGPSL